MATYIPVLGTYEAPFAILNGEDAVVDRDSTAAFQGSARPGVLKWIFQLSIEDSTADGENRFNIATPSPYKFTANDVNANENSFWPHCCICPINADGITLGAVIYVDTGEGVDWNVANQTVPVRIDITAPDALLAIYNVIIDFSHTAIS